MYEPTHLKLASLYIAIRSVVVFINGNAAQLQYSIHCSCVFDIDLYTLTFLDFYIHMYTVMYTSMMP